MQNFWLLRMLPACGKVPLLREGKQQFAVLNSCIMDRNILGFVTILCFVEFNYGR
jgi:hypothetical protein